MTLQDAFTYLRSKESDYRYYAVMSEQMELRKVSAEQLEFADAIRCVLDEIIKRPDAQLPDAQTLSKRN
jgi:hypothetical protein